ncbi:MAG TPA: HNH endonuclease [Bacteroidales bacterium]|nr:HNH endonuclease [Bacteroidales bacterium]
MSSQNFKNENWKRLDFEGLHPDETYEISDYGRMRRIDKHTHDWKVIEPSDCKGYKIFSFKTDIEGKASVTKLIHRLVAEAFIDRDSDLQNYVIHLDYNKSNNHMDNLRWVTRSTMFAHHRFNPNYKRGQINNAKLTETEVIRLKMKLKRGKTKLYKIAKEFGITHTQLNRIRSGENWGHIKID